MAKDLGVEASVIFRDRFVTPQEMVELIGAADIYITPYKHKGQVVSGTLAYALSAGKAIISTPYLHAIELLDDERGVLVPFDDPQAIADQTIALLDNGTARHAMRKRAYLYGRDMVWDRVAQQYMGSFERVYNERLRNPRATWYRTIRKDTPRMTMPVRSSSQFSSRSSGAVLRPAPWTLPRAIWLFCGWLSIQQAGDFETA
jgi:hypothetical protein